VRAHLEALLLETALPEVFQDRDAEEFGQDTIDSSSMCLALRPAPFVEGTMVTNPLQLDELLISFQYEEALTFAKKVALLEGMYQLARDLGQFSPDRALEGIEHDIQLAASLHSLVRPTSG
jgi:hypothetical protein